MIVKFFEPGLGYMKIKPEIDSELQRVLSAGDLILRKDVEVFEQNLAKYVGTKYAVACASGTDALILSLKVAGIQFGDKVLVPSYSFRATIEAVVHAGGIPMLYDLGDILEVPEGIKYFIPAHIAGEVSKTTSAHISLLQETGIIVIEDACQAIGAAPIKGLTACYSFYPAKLLGCYGDGGAIATNDENIYRKLLILRNHNKGDWKEVGYNSRLDNLQAAVLNVKIKYLPEAIKRRKEIAQMYDNSLQKVIIPTIRDVYQDYIIECPNRDGLKTFLTNANIESMENGYPYPDIAPKGPNTLAYEAKTLRIPCNENLTDEQVKYVIEKINEYGNLL